ncbi:MAG TPA: pyrroline-5-carboxylate reductase [Anaerohalosphaeraceae bacterium]|nr:pyrroline-5-carboxylate reductase [Anaerohalosphaeraceae bacterium]
MQKKTLGFIGGGNMAQALLKGLLQQKIYRPEQIWVSDVLAERLEFLRQTYGVHTSADNRTAAGKADILILAVKPQQMAAVLKEIADSIRRGVLVISIAAGIRTAKIRSFLPQNPIIRVMPNTPAMVSAGASALYNAGALPEQMQEALRIFESVGKAVVAEQEELLDAVTAVSGSGPAYFFLLMEEMLKAAAELGLDEATARALVLQTAKGAALLAEEAAGRGETPDILRKKVTSPGGTTEAALKVFGEYSFGPMVRQALLAAARRSRELSA